MHDRGIRTLSVDHTVAETPACVGYERFIIESLQENKEWSMNSLFKLKKQK